MSFMEYPQPDACRALMPSPEPPPPGPPGRPMVCHMPKGHEGLHAITRRPRTLDRRWEGDARPSLAVPADTDDSRERAELTRRAEQLWSNLIDQDKEGAVGILRQYVAAMDHIGEQWAATASRPAEPTGELREQVARWLQDNTLMRNGCYWYSSEPDLNRYADELLAGPLAPLLAKLRAAEAREEIARIEGCAGALNAAVHEVDDDEDAQLLARRAIQWEQEADALRAALAAPLAGQHTTDGEGQR